MKILSTGNPKILKGIAQGFNTYILHLAPYTLSGHNTCPKATPGCIASCLNTAGRGGMFKKGETTNMIQQARIRKTKQFFQNREQFFKDMVADIRLGLKQSKRLGLTPVYRPNGTSDIAWEKYGLTVDGVEYNNKIWFIVHKQDILKNYKNDNIISYVHIFVVFDKNMNLIGFSKQFKFENTIVEYCIGMEVYNDNFIIIYSTCDSSTKLSIFPVDYINSLIVNN